jgi:hypothetical protein
LDVKQAVRNAPVGAILLGWVFIASQEKPKGFFEARIILECLEYFAIEMKCALYTIVVLQSTNFK